MGRRTLLGTLVCLGPSVVAAQMVVEPLRWALRGFVGHSAEARGVVQEKPREGRRRLLMRTATTYGVLVESVEKKDDVVVVGADIVVEDPIVVTYNLSMSSGDAGPFALDGQSKSQVLVVRDGADLLLEDLIIRNAVVEGTGAAVSVLGGTLELVRCLITGGRAESGAAIYASQAVIRATESEFQENSATTTGGAVVLSESDMTAVECKFAMNSASRGGAIYVTTRSRLTLTGGTLTDNRATASLDELSRGGALYVINSTATLTGSKMSSNAADEGGAVAALISVVVLSDVSATHNTARYGGAMSFKQTSVSASTTAVQFNNAEFVGGGIYLSSKSTLESSVDTIVKDNTPDDVSQSSSSQWADESSRSAAFKTAAEAGMERQLDATPAPTYITPVPTYATMSPTAA